MDLQCPFSKKAWSMLLEAIDFYSEETVHFIVQPVVLGNHCQCWDATKSAVAIAQSNTNQFINSTSYLYQHQEEYRNSAFNTNSPTR